jgi:TolB-like protein
MLAVVVGLIAWVKFSARPAAPASGFTRVAVLPMKDLSPSPTPYLADALTDQLIATLGQIQSLRVTAPGSTARFKNSTTGADEISRQLEVDALVETSVTSERTASDAPLRAHVDARVVKAGVAIPLWAGSVEWVAGDTHALEAGLAREIARAVNAAVTAGERSRIDAPRQTNPNAEEAYLRGRAELMTYGPDAARRALQEFERAVSFDSRHAGAHAGASRAYVVLGQFGAISAASARQSALAAARTAVELDADLAEAHRALADLSFYYDWDWAAAEREYGKTLELNPSFSPARITYSELLAMLRRFPEAVKQAEVGQSLDPQASQVKLAYAVVLLYARRFPDAEKAVQQALLLQPDSARAYLMQGRVAEAQGRYAEALESVRWAAELPGGNGVPMQVTLLQLQARAGHRDEATAGLADLERRAASEQIRLTHRDRAYVLLALGDESRACDEFERSFEERDSGLMWLSVDPRVDALRSNPRFQAILKRMRLS